MKARPPAPLLLTTIATFVLTAGCSSMGQSDTASPETTSTAPTETGVASADPLAGEWRSSFTCQDAVRAVKRRIGTHWEGWEPENAEPGEPCAGEGNAAVELIARFSDGVMALCEPTGVCEVHATYEYPEASVVRIDDTEGNLCDPGKTCPVDWHYRIDGNELDFTTADNPWTISTWESAPWIRSS